MPPSHHSRWGPKARDSVPKQLSNSKNVDRGVTRKGTDHANAVFISYLAVWAGDAQRCVVMVVHFLDV